MFMNTLIYVGACIYDTIAFIEDKAIKIIVISYEGRCFMATTK